MSNLFTPHDYHNRDDGLSHCKVCNGAEGTLTGHCPLQPMTAEQQDAVMAGTLDYKYGQWWAPVGQPISHIKRDTIKQIFTSNGFQLKDEGRDLKNYVYQAAFALLAYVQRTEQMATLALRYYMTECTGAEPSISVFHRMVDEALNGVPMTDSDALQLAESVNLIGPGSRTDDLHAAIQRYHDLICANATVKAAAQIGEAMKGLQAEIAALKQQLAGEQFTAEQAVELAQAQQTSIIRATVAACMEAAGLSTLSVNLEAQRTIWDRQEFETARNPEHTHVTFSLFQR